MTTNLSSTSPFTLSFEGPSLSNNRMSVRELGPSLVALGDLFDRASAVSYTDTVSVDLTVTANRPGSFEIDLAVDMIRFASTMFDPALVTSARFLKAVALTTISTIKWRRGNVGQAADQREFIRIKVQDDEFEAAGSPETVRRAIGLVDYLSQDQIFGQASRRVLEPLTRDGIDRADIKQNGNLWDSIVEEDLPAFGARQEPVILSDITFRNPRLVVIGPYLGPRSSQWKFRDSDGTNPYAMMDEDFARQVRNGDRPFRADDILDCEVRHVIESDTRGRIITHREIVRVYHHSSPRERGLQSGF